MTTGQALTEADRRSRGREKAIRPALDLHDLTRVADELLASGTDNRDPGDEDDGEIEGERRARQETP